MSAKGAFYGILASLVGMVVFVYGNWMQNDVITVVSAVGIVAVNLAFCVAMKRSTTWTESAGAAAGDVGLAVE